MFQKMRYNNLQDYYISFFSGLIQMANPMLGGLLNNLGLAFITK